MIWWRRFKCRRLGLHCWYYGEERYSRRGERRRVCMVCGQDEIYDSNGWEDADRVELRWIRDRQQAEKDARRFAGEIAAWLNTGV